MSHDTTQNQRMRRASHGLSATGTLYCDESLQTVTQTVNPLARRCLVASSLIFIGRAPQP